MLVMMQVLQYKGFAVTEYWNRTENKTIGSVCIKGQEIYDDWDAILDMIDEITKEN
jgi:hypothetical protein